MHLLMDAINIHLVDSQQIAHHDGALYRIKSEDNSSRTILIPLGFRNRHDRTLLRR